MKKIKLLKIYLQLKINNFIKNIIKDYICSKFSVENKSFYLFFKVIMDEYNNICENNTDTNKNITYFKFFLESLKSEINKGYYDSYQKLKNE